MNRLKDLSKVQIETLRSSKNSKKLTEMARNENVLLTPEEIGHVFASETFPCEDFIETGDSETGKMATKQPAPYGRYCMHNLKVKFVSTNDVTAIDTRWCGTEYNNECPFLENEKNSLYCNYIPISVSNDSNDS